ncbi:putative signal transducing protein [Sediminicola luteus]|uniref:DUF2007 domain-containing protein n=1 Tax=Sediminicola luteus TaxID=319238 RepID=A0A2A4G491_9FLAO|nr:DUF2007 domain-containing protein [Sediminicola luteus]PCE62784.1 hypothetical protein B7P33_15985 [Sediminicola luteus]
MKQQEFHILGSFEYAAEVQVIKAKLESEGIPVFLLNENTLNSDPLISHAIGGVQIQVYTKDKDRAQEIFDELRTYAVDDSGQPLPCPNCKRPRLEAYYQKEKWIYRLFPFFEPKKYRCTHCQFITRATSN